MNVLVYPSTHPHASSVCQTLYSILVPHYLPQTISPDVLAAPQNPWHLACVLLVLLAAPDHHAGVREYAEKGGRILALGVNANRSQGLFGLYDSPSTFGSTGLGLVKDTSVLRLADEKASLHLSFPSQTVTPDAIVNKTAVKRTPSATLDLGEGICVLGRYTGDETLAGALSQSGILALWSCATPLPEQLLVPTLSALGLQFDIPGPVDAQQPKPGLLPQLLLAHPKKWDIRRHIMQDLFPDRDLETAFSVLTVEEDTQKGSESVVFPDDQDVFQFHVVRTLPPAVTGSNHPILNLLSEETKEEPKNIILTTRPLTAEQEGLYTPLFSPSTFFAALDEFRSHEPTDELLFGDLLLYGEVVTSTQTTLDKNPKFLRALPSPLLYLATKQVAGRGRGKNAWLSPAGSMLLSLRLSVSLKRPGAVLHDFGSIRASNLVFIQYLFALAVVEACEILDPTKAWASKIKLKWPNDIYGEFPAEETSRKAELKKLGGILVNTSFCGSTADVIVGCGLNILNEPPIGSLAQLESLKHGKETSSALTVERVTAAVLTSFERMWKVFVADDDFRPFMDQYTQSWLHSGQTVTLTTVTPHTTVRIVGITPDHGLLRTEPLSGGQYVDLQPDSNSFDMLKGLIRTKAA